MSVEVLADSINADTGVRVTSFLFKRFWKPLQAELRTHRQMSQSHFSSRAIPVEKVIEQVINDPYLPMWTAYQKGMGGKDTLTMEQKEDADCLSKEMRNGAVYNVRKLLRMEVAKQDANRYLEPWMHGNVVITGDDSAWQSFFALRCADGVQPDMRYFAEAAQYLRGKNSPQVLQPGEWHIAFIMPEEKERYSIDNLLVTSAARSARTSYNRDGEVLPFDKDAKLVEMLKTNRHATPFEHQLLAMPSTERYANFTSWKTQRCLIGL